MANKKSSKKRVRQTLVKTENNRKALSQIKTIVRAARTAVSTKTANSEGTVDNTVKNAVAALMKAASKGLLPKKAASRRVSRMTRAANANAAAKT